MKRIKYLTIILFIGSLPFLIESISFDSGLTSQMPRSDNAFDIDNDQEIESYIQPNGTQDDLDVSSKGNFINPRHDNLLMRTVLKNNVNQVQILLQDPTNNVNFQNKDGVTALHYAAKNGDGLITTLLLEHHADPNICDHGQNSPLHVAVDQNSFRVGKTPLDYAENNRMTKILQTLIQ